jgi:hypothetical protein
MKSMCYNLKMSLFSRVSGRLVLGTTFALIVGFFAYACHDDEVAFFIEHVKTQPDAPDCEVTTGDNYTSGGYMDLALAGEFYGWFLVQNQLLAREDYANLKAETNGIFVEGVEVYIRTGNQEVVGSSEYYPQEFYIEPESEEIVGAVMVPYNAIQAIANQAGCLPLSKENYPNYSVYPPSTSNNPYLDRNGSAFLEKSGTIYSVARILGHSGGGTDVETQEFTFRIGWCCGCLVNWTSCFDPCERYCEPPEEHGMCTIGVANGGAPYDCRNIYHDPRVTWGDCGSDADGDAIPCTCDSCSD